MGSGASHQGTDGHSSGSRHHQENEKNRLNPTEKVEKWKEKMLLDVGADPLSVIRDFPRMDVFFLRTEEEKAALIKHQVYKTYTNATADGDGESGGVRGTQERAGGEPTNKRKGKHTRASEGSGRHSSMGKYAAATDATMLGHHNDDNASREQATRSNPLTPNALRTREGSGGDASATGDKREEEVAVDVLDHDQKLFAARRRRLKQNVLTIAELVGEANTFGRWFQEVWEEKEREYFAAGAAAAGNTQSHSGTANAGAASRPSPANSLGQDPNDAPHTSGGAGNRATNSRSSLPQSGAGASMLTFNLIPSSSANTSNGPDIHQLFQTVCIECGMLNIVPEASQDTLNNTSGTTEGGLGPKKGSRGPSRGNSSPFAGSPSSVAFLNAERANGATTSNEAGALDARNTSGMLVHAKTEYTVASATFHAMQFIVQGIMFFPSQRLKHIFWFPWAPTPLYSDCDWKVFVYVQENVKSVTEFVYGKRMEHSAHKRGLAAASTPTKEGSPSALNSRSNRLDPNSAETAPLLSHQQSTGGLGFGSTDAASPPPAENISAGSRNTQRTKSLLVIKHLQVIQHFVEESEKKKVPKYQLDWTCTIYVDTQKLDHTYEAFGARQQAARRRRLEGASGGGGDLITGNEEGGGAPSATPSLRQGSLPQPSDQGGSLLEQTNTFHDSAAGQESAAPREEDHAPFPAADKDEAVPKQSSEPNSKKAVKATKLNLSGKPPPHNSASSHGNAANSANASPLLLSSHMDAQRTSVSVLPLFAVSSSGSHACPMGVKASDQKKLVADEVVFANIDVVGARVEKVKKGICGVPSAWQKNADELRFVLEEQYRVDMDEVSELKRGRY